MVPVGIIGGMGPFAGAHYVGLFLEECARRIEAGGASVTDQRFPPHYLFQLPVPDRTSALLGADDGYGRVLQALSGQMDGLKALGARVVAMSCNTAHAWHAELQGRHPDMTLLHIGEATADHLFGHGETEVGLLSTAGTVKSGIYAEALARVGIACREPDGEELDLVMRGIYDGVKAGDNELGRGCFNRALARMRRRTGVTGFLMACTEIPLALGADDIPPGCRLYDPGRLSARELARRALEMPAHSGHSGLAKP